MSRIQHIDLNELSFSINISRRLNDINLNIYEMNCRDRIDLNLKNCAWKLCSQNPDGNYATSDTTTEAR